MVDWAHCIKDLVGRGGPNRVSERRSVSESPQHEKDHAGVTRGSLGVGQVPSRRAFRDVGAWLSPLPRRYSDGSRSGPMS
jgi:hypothetical protein